jgi:hypothetical protein
MTADDARALRERHGQAEVPSGSVAAAAGRCLIEHAANADADACLIWLWLTSRLRGAPVVAGPLFVEAFR